MTYFINSDLNTFPHFGVCLPGGLNARVKNQLFKQILDSVTKPAITYTCLTIRGHGENNKT